MSTDVTVTELGPTYAVAAVAGCTTVRPRSTSTAVAGGASASRRCCIVITIVSLFASGLNLGLDFKGGVAWEVPVDQPHRRPGPCRPRAPTASTAPTPRSSGAHLGVGLRLLIQVGDQPVAEAAAGSRGAGHGRQGRHRVGQRQLGQLHVGAQHHREGHARPDRLPRSWSPCSSPGGSSGAWRSAAIVAMLHDVLISVGVYSVFRFEVTPATVVAFLDDPRLLALRHDRRVRQGQGEHASATPASRVPYADVINVSMNQVLMRSINTSLAAVLPVLSLLVLGAGILGAVTLREFALALLVGLITGSYSSIFVASPLLAMLKEREPQVPRRCAARTPPASTSSVSCSAARRPAKRDERGRALRAGQPATARSPAAANAGTPDARQGGCSPTRRDRGRRSVADQPERPGRYPGASWQSRWPLARTICVRDIADFPHAGRHVPRHHAAARRRRGVPPGHRRARPGASTASDVDRVLGIEARGFILAAPDRLSHGRRLRPGAQGRQAAVGGRPRGVPARVRHRQARDPPRRDPSRASGCW